MITVAEAGKLGAVHTVRPSVLSLYLAVPLDPAGLRDLPARANDLIAAAQGAGACGHAAKEDVTWILERLQVSGGDWLGRTVAMFACADAGLSEVFPLPCRLPDRAVLGIRPHIRPLLTAVQRCPAYQVAVVDRRRVWLFHVTDDEIETVTARAAAAVPPRPAHHHHRDTAATLEEVMAHGQAEPLVIGGRDEDIRQLFASLPASLHERFAGSFTADTLALTAVRVRNLAAPLVTRWAEVRAEQLAGQAATMRDCDLAATGLRACMAAVNACAVQMLIVPDDELVPGYECGRCGDLSVDADGCPDWGTAALPVPDVIEEMVTRTLEDGGEVRTVHDGLSGTVARLRCLCPRSASSRGTPKCPSAAGRPWIGPLVFRDVDRRAQPAVRQWLVVESWNDVHMRM